MGMEQKRIKLEPQLNSLENSDEPPNVNVLVTICENPQTLQDINTDNGNMQYEIRDANEILEYRRTTVDANHMDGNSTSSEGNTFDIISSAGNAQFYVVNNLSSSSPCIITPKAISEEPGCTRHLVVNASKKRDEKRRATHNEVERRRRDKINQWIFRLRDLLPENTDNKNKNGMGDSKGEILIRACDYIRSMQQHIESLKECLQQNDKLRAENGNLREENVKLQNEKLKLMALLRQKGGKYET